MRRTQGRAIVFFFILLLGQKAFAGPFTLSNRQYGSVPASLQAEIDAIFNQIETDVNTELPDADQSTYLKGMANATIMSGKGVGVDYATDPDLFIFGLGVGFGADIGNNTFSDLVSGNVDGNQIRGFGIQPSVMGGLNMRIFKLPRLKLFINYFDINKTSDSLSFQLKSLGAHAQIKLVPSTKKGSMFFKWSGVDLTFGVEHASLRLVFNKGFTVSKQTTLSGLGGTAVTATYTGNVVAGANVNTLSIPVEISTSMQLLYVLSTYAGLGMDFNSGSSKSLASLTGNVNVTDSLNAIGNVGADAGVNLGSKDSPDSFDARWFLGLQTNLTLLKIFGQLNKSFINDVWGVTIGARVAW